MRSSVAGLALGCFIVMILWVTGYGSALVERVTTNDPLAAGMQAVKSCVAAGGSATCMRAPIVAMLQQSSVADVMTKLSGSLTPLQCHYVGHVVGQQFFMQDQDVEAALAACTHTCDSACIHGVIGQAFAVALNHPDADDQNFDLEHLSPDDIRLIGNRLCDSAGACHGVGHVLYQAYREFEPAFAMCRSIGGASVVTCYNGVTMEYADILSARNMRAVPGVTFPDEKELQNLCVFKDMEETRACFRYFPRMMEETLERTGVSQAEAQQREQTLCQSYASLDVRIACFAGFGSHGSNLVLTNTAAAVAKCQGVSSLRDQAACVFGIVSVATGDRREPIAAFCKAQPSSDLRQSCYQGLFYALKTGDAIYDVSALCGTGNAECDAGAKDTSLNTWNLIRTHFSE